MSIKLYFKFVQHFLLVQCHYQCVQGFLEDKDRGSRIGDRGSRIEDQGSRIEDGIKKKRQ